MRRWATRLLLFRDFARAAVRPPRHSATRRRTDRLQIVRRDEDGKEVQIFGGVCPLNLPRMGEVVNLADGSGRYCVFTREWRYDPNGWIVVVTVTPDEAAHND
jgi:hypothetical protein